VSGRPQRATVAEPPAVTAVRSGEYNEIAINLFHCAACGRLFGVPSFT